MFSDCASHKHPLYWSLIKYLNRRSLLVQDQIVPSPSNIELHQEIFYPLIKVTSANKLKGRSETYTHPANLLKLPYDIFPIRKTERKCVTSIK